MKCFICDDEIYKQNKYKAFVGTSERVVCCSTKCGVIAKENATKENADNENFAQEIMLTRLNIVRYNYWHKKKKNKLESEDHKT